MHSTHALLPIAGLWLALAGCQETVDTNDTDGSTNVHPPTVLWTDPNTDATGVPINAGISVGFSDEMDADTLTGLTFLVTSGDPPVAVLGTVITTDGTVSFWPSAHLASETTFEARITSDALNVDGVGLEADHTWSFTTGSTLAPGLPVNLGQANQFAILAKSGISTVPASSIIGDIGVSPVAATYITGFSLVADASNVFSTTPQVTGDVYAADYAPPTPAYLTTAVRDLERAFTDSAGRAADATELGAGNIGGMTLAPGVYRWSTGLLIPTDLTLSGNSDDVWIFQIAQDLTVSSGTQVTLTGGAVPENVFWQVSGLIQLGTTSQVSGIFLSQTSITTATGAAINGRLLAQTSVDLDSTVVVAPGQ